MDRAPLSRECCSLLAVIGERAHHDASGRGVHGDDHVRVARKQDVCASIVRGDDEHMVGSGFHEVGDLAKPRLGLGEAEWAAAAAELDVVYHSGAVVNFNYPYEAARPATLTQGLELVVER